MPLSPVKVYAKQVLGPYFDIAKSEKAVKVNKLFLKKMAALPSLRRVDSWTGPPWNVPVQTIPVQTIPVHLIHFLRNV